MGMYDHLHYAGEMYQTKSFECEMGDYFIEGGRLLKDIGHYEDVPKAERPYPDAPDNSLLGMFGMIRWVSTGREDMNYHGIIYCDGASFQFTDGNLVEVITEPH